MILGLLRFLLPDGRLRWRRLMRVIRVIEHDNT